MTAPTVPGRAPSARPTAGAVVHLREIREVTRTGKPVHGRDPWPDNARLVAAVLIVVMHLTSPVVDDSSLLRFLDDATWPLRVPLYALLAGYFSSTTPLDRRRAVSLVRNIGLVYLLFDLLASVHKWLLGSGFGYDPLRPSFALWFLLALFMWRLLLPLVVHVRGIVPLSFLVALGAGLIPTIGAEASLSRMLCFFPVFLVGSRLRTAGLRETLSGPWRRAAALVVLGGWAAAAYLLEDVLVARWFSMRAPYRDGHELVDAVARGGILLLGTAAALAMLALVPRRRLPLVTYLGAGSMYIYLLHPFVVRHAVRSGYYGTVDSRTDVLVLLLGATVVGVLLATPPVRRLARPLVQPRWEWPFVPEGGGSAWVRAARPLGSVTPASGVASTVDAEPRTGRRTPVSPEVGPDTTDPAPTDVPVGATGR